MDGYLTRNGVADYSSRLETTYHYGASTGKTSGHISDYMVYGGPNCYDMNGYGIEFGMTTAAGDSGGPHYADMAAGVYMIAVHSYGSGDIGTVCNSSATGSAGGFAAYRLASDNGAGFTFVT